MQKEIPKGLVFSSKSPKRKKKALTVTFILVLVQTGLIWPVFPLFSSPTPQILGFPLPFAWAILMLSCSFTTLLIFFLNDKEGETE